jgi:hypothetical protein
MSAKLGKSIEDAFHRFKGALENGDIKIKCSCHKEEEKTFWKRVGISLLLHSLLFCVFLYLLR